MQVALAGLFVLALIALVAGPVMARRGAAPAAPMIVAAVDAKDSAKALPAVTLDSYVKGVVRVVPLSSKLDDKWRVSSLACSDVTVVALSDGKMVASAPATSDPLDPAGCVYSMKVPSGGEVSVYAQLTTAQSVGVTSHAKLDSSLKSDVVTEKLQRPGGLKSSVEFVKLRDGRSSDALPLYFKLDPVPLIADTVTTAGSPSPAPVAALGGKDTGKALPAYKLDTFIKGVVRVDASFSKTALKWRISSLACSDVTVVALVDDRVVASATATSDPANPAGCVYSMKIPSGGALSIYAQLGTAQSIGVSSQKVVQGSKDNKVDVSVVTSDAVSEKMQRPGAMKSAPQFVKLRTGDSISSLPLYLKLDS